MIPAEQIVALYTARKNELQGVNAKRAEVRAAYNGELKVHVPDVGRAEPPAVANLLARGVDQMAQRVASTLPTIVCPPRDDTVKREMEAAKKRRQALYGWWEANDLGLMVDRRARLLIAYAQSPVMLWPDLKRGIPVWRMRDPFGTYPAASWNPGDFTPPDCIFAYQQSYGWVQANYPDQFERLLRKDGAARDSKLTLLDYVDANELITMVLHDGPLQDGTSGYTTPTGYGTSFRGTSRHEVLERLTNKAEVCTAVVPVRVTLDRAIGQFDSMLSIFKQMAHLTALELIAVEKGIFPDIYMESRPNEQAKFVTGPHDGRTGKVNIIQGGTIREIGTNPGFQTNPTIDRLERAQRLDAGIPAEFGGESASNIRTGKRGDAVLSAAVDFPIQEMQKVIAASLREENKRAIAIAKGYFGGEAQSFYVGWKGAKGRVDFVPNEVFTTDDNLVRYSHAGSDLNALMIQLGQSVGMNALSLKTAREMMPLVEDADYEGDQITRERLMAALLAAWEQKVNSGEVAPKHAAWLMDQVGSNKLELPQAIMKLEELVQEEQRAALEQQADPAQPDPMAGLATGTPAEAQVVPPQIGGPNESQQGLASLLSSLRRPQMTLASEEGAA